MTQLSRRHLLFGRFRQAAQGGGPSPLRPPWSLAWSGDDRAFTRACSRCDECLKVCPPAVLRRGDGGYPEIDFSQAGCSLCRECAKVCPSGAFVAAAATGGDAQPWDLRVDFGSACLPRSGVECRSCGEHCEAGAIRFRLRAGGPPLPELDGDACTGCGECVAVCPVGALAPRRLSSFSTAAPAAAGLSLTEAP
ncbi:ferredoxin-type protein NapF [Oryzomicrobium terrae]|uniref:Ferredoxin-type protein NapF n=1 Tax=Oryzomicrobium terrae TaxID=1735038 RepID=A0A5C1E4Q5_9RHOO|nr:ferredoxin-type protein NapF [Oryzomicrobium terrae]QEL63704.1 ferredoxin-type protein NapF [Oryzomicrobium terrae]